MVNGRRGWRRNIRRAILAGVLGAPLAAGAAGQRPELSLNDHWCFHFGASADVTQWRDEPADWPVVTLPHTWNARDGADGGNDYARGTGWYVRQFTIPAAWADRRVFLQFDGASRDARVFVNGRQIGAHEGGFARFRFDITDAVRRDRPNLLAVSVSNAPDGLPPISADFTFFGGLYRGVTLFATEAVHVDALDFGADGFYVTLGSVDAERATIAVATKIRNDGAAITKPTVHFELRDATGACVAQADTPVEVAPGAIVECAQQVSVEHPHRWNGRSDPYLYRASVSVRRGDTVDDEIEQRVGLRTFRVDPEQGFWLNGRHVDLHGVSRHQDRAEKGWAISAADDREDFGFVKEIGATALRVAHYPQSDLWFDLADENGIVVWAEIPVVNEVASTGAYTDSAVQQLRELIRQHYNHPSICFWGVGNETREVGDSPGHETPNAPTADRLIAALNDVVHAEDRTRLSTYASHHGNADGRNFHTDVMAFNKYFGWYGGKADDLAGWLDKVHAQYPSLRFGVSEYGAGGNIAQHDDTGVRPKPGGPWHPEEYQAYLHEQQWRALAARPFVWGKFVWNLFDLASDSRSEGDAPGMNDKGLVTYDRKTRKDAFYWYKANWSADPVLYITGRRFANRTEKKTEVKVYSNGEAVDLEVNGRALGPMLAEGRVFRREVELAEGENRIVAQAQIGGQAYADACVWTVVAAPSRGPNGAERASTLSARKLPFEP